MKTTGFLLRKLSRLILTVFLIATVVFLIVRVLPGDPAQIVAGIDGSSVDLSSVRVRLGTDKPILSQYMDWIWNTLRFDFGVSFFRDEPVLEAIINRVPITFGIALAAFFFSVVIAIPLGVITAVHRWKPLDWAGMTFAHMGMALPEFWLGIILLLVFSIHLGIFPLFGSDSVVHFVLPVTALALGRSAVLMRIVRSAMIDELRKEYVLAARAHGIPENTIRYRHVLRNAVAPVITIGAIQFGYLLGGTVIIEQLFSLPGLGRLLVTSISRRDLPLVQGGVMFTAFTFSIVNFVADILYSMVNPRIRLR
jgi:peptide/nickel transport system permease protein